MKSFLHKNTNGNAILISLGMTSLLFIVAAGATSVINSSLRQSPKVVNSSKAFFAAEGAVESALYEAAGRGSGYIVNAGTEAGHAAYIEMDHINRTKSSWATTGRTELNTERDRDENHEYAKTLFIPPRIVDEYDSGVPKFDLKNWKPIKFGESITFDLFVDNHGQEPGSDRNVTVGMGGVTGYTPSDESPCGIGLDHQVIGPNGICAQYTKSIFGHNYNSDGENDKLENIYIDLFLPNTYELKMEDEETDKLLTWTLTGRSGLTNDANTPRILTLQSAQNCDRINAGIDPLEPGSICKKHFDRATLPANQIEQHFDQFEEIGGTWVRLNNPVGIFRQKKKRFPLSMLKFAQREMESPDHATNIEPAMYFPQLTIHMGAPIRIKRDVDGPVEGLSQAYIRVGFVHQETTDMNSDGNSNGVPDFFDNFALPDDKVGIQAIGEVDGYKQRIDVNITPSQLAPMFDYAVFQP
jgi:hypothetical protein